MRKHWSESAHDNYPMVQECMQRDLFELLYSRFLPCSDPNAPPRQLPTGEDNPEYDLKWHIRDLEKILNRAWYVDLGQWMCYDEQMVKTVSTFSKGLAHFNPAKPITHGMKQYAASDRNGYCLINSIDGSFKGDPSLGPLEDCPLGKTTRHVLHVLLEECETLRGKLVGSGVFIAMANYFTSPTLFACLASHDIFAVATCRSPRTCGALPYMESLGHTIPNRGDMTFCRSGEMAFVQWRDSKEILLYSTVHIGETGGEGGGINHFKPVLLALKGKGRAGKHKEHDQPVMRMDYVKYMGGG
ncbi:unnamed protein product [Ectocarpus sp. CCAP 1310/34]|nr:unnamed protein product [Ectocarpus sp. CCAP 1310/34]